MVTINKHSDKAATDYVELFGLSTDTMPIEKIGDTYIANGSTYFCINTGSVYIYDSENKEWHLV